MNKNLSNYIKHYPCFFDKTICQQTIKELDLLEKSSWKEHTFYNPIKNEFNKIIRNSKSFIL